MALWSTSLPTIFTSKTLRPFAAISLKPIKSLHPSLSSSPSFLSLKRKLPSAPLVAQTSDWAREEEGENEVEVFEEGGEGEDQSEGVFVAEGENEGEPYPEPPEEAKLFARNLPFEIAEEASLDLKLPRRNLMVQFTCNACGQRTKRTINRVAYEKGTVFVQCAGCNVNHKLVDNLGLVVEYDLRKDPDAESVTKLGYNVKWPTRLSTA